MIRQLMRLVQLSHFTFGRRVALVNGAQLSFVNDFCTVHHLAQHCLRVGVSLRETVKQLLSEESIDYDGVYAGSSSWKLLIPFDHPEPARFFVTGTGLTHRASADNRQSMHDNMGPVSDSMKMYQIGLAGGRPEPGQVGSQPEWFYKGTGRILRAHNEPLTVPNFGFDGGEEAELAGVYLIDRDGIPRRVGLVQANEFSDHILEAQNYLYLASSKLREASIGPEIVLDADCDDIRGLSTIERAGKQVWSAPLISGEKNMCHTLANLEHHHFKYPEFRVAGDAHLHFFGADMFSFKDRLQLRDGDVMNVGFENFGRPLRNPIVLDRSRHEFVAVRAI
jgi:hypothetical protein